MSNKQITLNKREEEVVSYFRQRDRDIRVMVQSVMQYGVHYGPPWSGSKKVCLLQAGAEKLMSRFKLHPVCRLEFESLDNRHRLYTAHIDIQNETGSIVGAAIGLCATSETKIENGNKRNNPADDYNKAAKMAYKRALVSAVRSGLAASDLFDVDIPEYDITEQDLVPTPTPVNAKPEGKTKPSENNPESTVVDTEKLAKAKIARIITEQYPIGDKMDMSNIAFKLKTTYKITVFSDYVQNNKEEEIEQHISSIVKDYVAKRESATQEPVNPKISEAITEFKSGCTDLAEDQLARLDGEIYNTMQYESEQLEFKSVEEWLRFIEEEKMDIVGVIKKLAEKYNIVNKIKNMSV